MKRTYDWTPALEVRDKIKEWLDAGHTLMLRKHIPDSYPIYSYAVRRGGVYHRGASARADFDSLGWTGFDVIPPSHED